MATPTIGSLFRAKQDISWFQKVSVQAINSEKMISLLETCQNPIHKGDFVQIVGISTLKDEMPVLVNTNAVLYKIMPLSQMKTGFFKLQEGGHVIGHQLYERAYLEFTHFFEFVQ